VRESTIEGKVKAWARSKGILALKMTPRGVVGYPDDFFFYQRKVAIIEFKAPGKRPEPIQKVRMEELMDLGFPVLLCDDVDDGIMFLKAVFFGRQLDTPTLPREGC
jgi:hypothetical protein